MNPGRLSVGCLVLKDRQKGQIKGLHYRVLLSLVGGGSVSMNRADSEK
jgi:hypothetical protein